MTSTHKDSLVMVQALLMRDTNIMTRTQHSKQTTINYEFEDDEEPVDGNRQLSILLSRIHARSNEMNVKEGGHESKLQSFLIGSLVNDHR